MNICIKNEKKQCRKSEKRRKKLNAKYDKFINSIKNKYDYYTSEELRRAKFELEDQLDYNKRSSENFSQILAMVAIIISLLSTNFTLFTYDPPTTNEIRTPDKKITVIKSDDQDILDYFFQNNTENSKSSIASIIQIEPNPDIENKELAMIMQHLITFTGVVLGISYLEYFCRNSFNKSWKIKIEINILNDLIQRKKNVVKLKRIS